MKMQIPSLLTYSFLLALMMGQAHEGLAANAGIPQGADAVARNHFDKAVAAMARRDFVSARGDFRYVLHLKYDTGYKTVSYLNLGAIEFMEGNLEAAIKNYQSAIELKPDYAEAYFNMGTAYYKQGNLKQAEQAFLKALELQPEYGRAHYSLGSLYLDQKKYDLARKHAEKAQELGIPYKALKEKLAKSGSAS